MNTLEKTFALLIVGTTLLAIYFLQPILTPFLVGIGLAYLGDPLVDRLERSGMSRTVGVILVFIVLLAIFTAAFFVVVPVMFREIGSLIRDIPTGIAWLQQTASPYMLTTFGIDPFNVNLDILKSRLSENWEQAGGLMGSVISKITASGYVLAATIANIALTPVVTFYMLRDWDEIIQKYMGILNDNPENTTNLLMDIPEKHPGYTHMALDVNDIVSVQHNLNNLKIEITEGPITLPDGAKMIFIRDQDRNVIEFHQAAE